MSKLAIIFKLFIMILYNLYSIINSEGWLRTKLYDKREDFNFLIVRIVITMNRTYYWLFVT
jgi:hypothetical protein